MKRDLSQSGASGSFIYDPRFRGLLFQIVVGAVVVLFFAELIHNVIDNLARNRITSGFGFLQSVAGFDISQTLIDYSLQSTIWRAFWVGLLNTLLIAVLGIVFATILGFIVGIARLSSNWLVARVADCYVASHPQYPAAAASAVLVQRRTEGAAGLPRQSAYSRRRTSQQSRIVFGAADDRSKAARAVAVALRWLLILAWSLHFGSGRA